MTSFTSNELEIINKTSTFIKNKLQGEASGHDWWHVYRVWNNAKLIAQKEPSANKFIIELGALLHDVADWKFHNGDTTIGPKIAREFLEKLDVEENIIAEICEIIATISFKGANVKSSMKTLEGAIVQDADRLDALGAVGIARTFAYGGHAGSEMYNPEIKPILHNTYEEYKNKKTTSINHFYEKLLLLAERMNTQTAKEIAIERQKFMEYYLKQFFAEWNGEL